MNLRSIYYALSPQMRLMARKIVYYPIDLLQSISGTNKKLPKKGDIFIGSGDFVKQGEHQLELLQAYADLKPEATVLDVGCGIGRTAFALQSYLTKKGRYDGFDVVEKGIKWCQKNISTAHPNFHFRHVPLSNDLYSITHQKAELFTFPYEANTFDTVFLFSVFTHMQPLEVQNYLDEISRVLKPEGKCLSTFFSYNESNKTTISDSKSKFPFPFDKNGYKLMNEKVPSANIAFAEETLGKMFDNSGLKLISKIDGTWKNSSQSESLRDFQDVLVFKKKVD